MLLGKHGEQDAENGECVPCIRMHSTSIVGGHASTGGLSVLPLLLTLSHSYCDAVADTNFFHRDHVH